MPSHHVKHHPRVGKLQWHTHGIPPSLRGRAIIDQRELCGRILKAFANFSFVPSKHAGGYSTFRRCHRREGLRSQHLAHGPDRSDAQENDASLATRPASKLLSLR